MKYAGLDHIAHFINALDSEGLTGLEVRKAIYAECTSGQPGGLGGHYEMRGTQLWTAYEGEHRDQKLVWDPAQHPIEDLVRLIKLQAKAEFQVEVRRELKFLRSIL